VHVTAGAFRGLTRIWHDLTYLRANVTPVAWRFSVWFLASTIFAAVMWLDRVNDLDVPLLAGIAVVGGAISLVADRDANVWFVGFLGLLAWPFAILLLLVFTESKIFWGECSVPYARNAAVIAVSALIAARLTLLLLRRPAPPTQTSPVDAVKEINRHYKLLGGSAAFGLAVHGIKRYLGPRQ
jgi:hypothetical protein